MRKFIIIYFLVFLFIGARMAVAYEPYSSATFQKSGLEKIVDIRSTKLSNFFAKFNSPLKDHAEDIVRISDKYDIDYKLLPAISGIESTFAKFYPYGTYNAYGWGGGTIPFKNWEESFEIVLSSLKKNYIDRGADTVEAIARIYCPPNYLNWTRVVKYFMGEIENTSQIASIYDLAPSL